MNAYARRTIGHMAAGFWRAFGPASETASIRIHAAIHIAMYGRLWRNWHRAPYA